MNFESILHFTAGVAGVALAFWVYRLRSRTLAERAIVVGLLLFATEAMLSASIWVMGSGQVGEGMLSSRLLVGHLIAPVWLLAGLSYSRGNYWKFVMQWTPLVMVLFLVPWVVFAGWRSDIVAHDRPGVGVENMVALKEGGMVLAITTLLGAVLVLMHFEKTLEASVGRMRWQLKFLILGVGVLFATRIYTTSQMLLYRASRESDFTTHSVALLLAFVPIAISCQRIKTAKPEVYPSERMLQFSITVLLAGLYLLVVGAGAKAVAFFGISSNFPLETFLLMLSMLALAALLLSDRIRCHIRQAIVRHLKRPQHDYRQIWMTLTERTTGLMHEQEFSREVVRWLSETFQALSVTLWRSTERGLVSVASTSNFSGLEQAPQPIAHANASLDDSDFHPRRLQETSPLLSDAEPDDEHWAVPLRFRGQTLGLVVIGKRVNSIPFSDEDLELLKCIGQQAASNLLKISLANDLAKARELEGMQTVAAFFVHDLKNVASTLSIMLQNLKMHFANPAFREDAIRAVAHGVAHLNATVGRLSALRQKLELKPVPCNLNAVVDSVLATLPNGPEIQIEKDFAPVEILPLDSEQFGKVVSNVVLNAREALPGKGSIRVQTAQENGWAVLTVTDNGCGMTRDFVSEKLFRPFETTKRQGLGIGLYQSKMIVEAHHGKLEVTSALGVGTTFRILLPAPRTVL
ncbi:MAG: XrtA/PEP-CTERM system histidine kinase PrsK [Verrucomicrobiota bacterium]